MRPAWKLGVGSSTHLEEEGIQHLDRLTVITGSGSSMGRPRAKAQRVECCQALLKMNRSPPLPIRDTSSMSWIRAIHNNTILRSSLLSPSAATTTTAAAAAASMPKNTLKAGLFCAYGSVSIHTRVAPTPRLNQVMDGLGSTIIQLACFILVLRRPNWSEIRVCLELEEAGDLR